MVIRFLLLFKRTVMIARTFRSHFFKLYLNFNFPQFHTEISPQIKPLKNPIIYKYLIDTLNFPKVKAIRFSERFRRIDSLEQPQSVINLLKSFGLSDSQVKSAVTVCPQILFADVDEILRPKLRFFKELGFSDSGFGKFIAKNSSVLTRSLDDTLKPSVETLKKIIGYDVNNKYLVGVLSRCNWVVDGIINARIVSNVLYFKSCGIDDKYLSKLFKLQPRLFAAPESELRAIIEEISELGFPMNSKMLIYAIYTVGTLSSETLERKFELIWSFGYSKDECLEMFRRLPSLFRTSEVKLRFALAFLLDTVKLKKSLILHDPACLMHSVQDRLVARYRVMKTLTDKGLLKKEPAFLNVLHLPEKEFLEKYISKYEKDGEELLYAYKVHLLESSSEEEHV